MKLFDWLNSKAHKCNACKGSGQGTIPICGSMGQYRDCKVCNGTGLK